MPSSVAAKERVGHLLVDPFSSFNYKCVVAERTLLEDLVELLEASESRERQLREEVDALKTICYN